MKKIPSLFQRNYDGDRLVRDEVTPGCEWVLAGEGVPTRKWDGTCCLVRDGKLYKRYQVKRGATPPDGFEPACDVDPVTGKQQGWILVGEGPEDLYHREPIARLLIWGKGKLPTVQDGTYELVGPKVQGNPERLTCHMLLRHGEHPLARTLPRTFTGLKEYLAANDIEGIVWHHPDGRMAKIKTKDFGLKRREE